MPENSWEGFLPPHSIHMTRAPASVPHHPGTLTTSIITDAAAEIAPALCPLVLACHLEAPDARELFEKMIAAMGIPADQVVTVEPQTLPSNLPGARIVVIFGERAVREFLGTDTPLAELRGQFHSRHGVKVMPTWHPADLVRNPALKRETWNDLKQVVAELSLS